MDEKRIAELEEKKSALEAEITELKKKKDGESICRTCKKTMKKLIISGKLDRLRGNQSKRSLRLETYCRRFFTAEEIEAFV